MIYPYLEDNVHCEHHARESDIQKDIFTLKPVNVMLDKRPPQRQRGKPSSIGLWHAETFFKKCLYHIYDLLQSRSNGSRRKPYERTLTQEATLGSLLHRGPRV
jgi:hypothetical protein